MSLAEPGRSGVLDLALVALDVLGGAGGGNGGAFTVGLAGRRATADDLVAVDPAGVVGAPGAAGVAGVAGVAGAAEGPAVPTTAPATISLDSLFAITGAPNSSVRSTVCGRTVFTSKNDCLT